MRFEIDKIHNKIPATKIQFYIIINLSLIKIYNIPFKTGYIKPCRKEIRFFSKDEGSLNVHYDYSKILDLQ